jgi:hypothetical protein
MKLPRSQFSTSSFFPPPFSLSSEGALLLIQPSFEEKARGIVRYGLLFSGGREESLDSPHEDARVQDIAVALRLVKGVDMAIVWELGIPLNT